MIDYENSKVICTFKHKTGRGVETWPWISFEDFDEQVKSLENPDELVIEDENLAIIFSYPLEKEFIFYFANKEGWTRKELGKAISEKYKEIYKEENDAAGDPGMIPGMMNRATSKGPYGIWGHVLGDLDLSSVNQNPDGKYWLSIES
jgi:hypothetical protein